MSKLRTSLVVALFASVVAVPALSWSKVTLVYSLWANKPGTVTDSGTVYIPSLSNSVVSWQEDIGPAFAHARVWLPSGGFYEFNLVELTGAPDYAQINGYWDVLLNGMPLCTRCKGLASNLYESEGGQLTISVENGRYVFTGGITTRHEYY
jgi:hypothetical protein